MMAAGRAAYVQKLGVAHRFRTLGGTRESARCLNCGHSEIEILAHDIHSCPGPRIVTLDELWLLNGHWERCGPPSYDAMSLDTSPGRWRYPSTLWPRHGREP